jgi:hypothetical protein
MGGATLTETFSDEKQEKVEGRRKNYERGKNKQTEVRTKNADWNERGERHAR